MLNPDGTKTCPRCLSKLPTSQFYRINRKSKFDGFSGYCKSCTKAKAVLWQNHNPEKMHEKHAQDSARVAEKRRLGLLTPEQKESQKAATKKWRKANPERVLETQRECARKSKERNPHLHRAKRTIASNRQRAAHRGVPSDFTVHDWLTLLSLFDNKCAFCNSHPKFLDLEHLTPLHRGGFNVVGNVVPACRICNSCKSYLDPAEFAHQMGVDLCSIRAKARFRDSVFPTSEFEESSSTPPEDWCI